MINSPNEEASIPEVLCAFALPSLVMEPPSSPLYELPPIFGLFFKLYFIIIGKFLVFFHERHTQGNRAKPRLSSPPSPLSISMRIGERDRYCARLWLLPLELPVTDLKVLTLMRREDFKHRGRGGQYQNNQVRTYQGRYQWCWFRESRIVRNYVLRVLTVPPPRRFLYSDGLVISLFRSQMRRRVLII